MVERKMSLHFLHGKGKRQCLYYSKNRGKRVFLGVGYMTVHEPSNGHTQGNNYVSLQQRLLQREQFLCLLDNVHLLNQAKLDCCDEGLWRANYSFWMS